MDLMQPDEQAGQIFVLIIDETYGSGDEAHAEASERLRCSLEAEFGTEFQEANVGPGADLPAFLTIVSTANVPLWALLLGAFFMGRSINENLDAWSEIARKIKPFFGRRVILARNGAAALAVEAVLEELGGLPKAIRLVGYRPCDIGDKRNLQVSDGNEEIRENPQTLFLGQVLHEFEIEADGLRFRVTVDGKSCSVTRL